MYYKLHASDSWQSDSSATHTGSSLTGYQHTGDSLGTPDFPIYIKGHFYFKVDVDDPTPVNKMSMTYVHDTSYGSSFCYSIAYGPASIGVVPSDTNVGYNTATYYFNY